MEDWCLTARPGARGARLNETAEEEGVEPSRLGHRPKGGRARFQAGCRHLSACPSGIHQAPGEGLEPPRRGRLINSEVRLPFRHPGIKRAEHTRVTQYDRIRENLTTENTENTERNQRVERPFREVDTKKIITFVAITETQMSVLCLPGYRCAIVLFCCLSFPSSVVSVLLTVNFFEPCANSWAKTKYEPLSIGSCKLFICQKLNAPKFRR